MNNSRSTLKSDLSAHPWFENNFSLEVEEFCSPDNIDNCLKYISQEFSALGYPPISSSCPYMVNCDIVKLLNVVFEILKDLKAHVESKEELENRNQRLSSDLTILSKKNSQLKESLEQIERKLISSLEKERQLKVKNEQLQSLFKTEKDESKKLCAQIHQQKIAYQREIRKNENSLAQMKKRLNQILTDKNPDKKIASISTSHLLQRNLNQRGKWKTGSIAKSSTDDMYSSVISTYENRCKVALKDLEECKQCYQFIEQQLEATISIAKDNSHKNALPCLSSILNGNNVQQELIQKFSALLTQVQDIITNKVSDNKKLLEELTSLRFEIMQLKSNENATSSSQQNSNSSGGLVSHPCEMFAPSNNKELCDSKKCRNKSEQIELASKLTQIKEEKYKLEAQKLELIKSAIKQSSSDTLQCSKSVPSFCILTSKNGITSVPAAHQLKQCLDHPEDTVRLMHPLWKADILSPTLSSPDTASACEESISSDFSRITSPQSLVNDSLNDDLPNWARISSNVSISDDDSSRNLENFKNMNLSTTDDISRDDINLSLFESTEDDKLAKLKAVAEDIENRRQNILRK